MSATAPKRIDATSHSDVGRVRSVNQDCHADLENERGFRLLVVADGMGGHRGGETASRLAVETIREVFEQSEEPIEITLLNALRAANERVHRRAGENANLAGMGTTVVALCLGEGNEAWVAHVGDSRLYRLRKGSLEMLTNDHSVVAEMQRQGILSSEQAQAHPRRNELTRSVGVAASVEIDLGRITAEAGDRFLLCSDGLCGCLGDDLIREVLESEPPRSAAHMLVERANAMGGYDNVTVQVVAVCDTAANREDSDGTAMQRISDSWPEMDRPQYSRRRRRIRRLSIAASFVLVMLIAATVAWLNLRC